MEIQEIKKKQTAKLQLLEKLKNLKIKSDNQPLIQVSSSNSQPKLLDKYQHKLKEKTLNLAIESNKITSYQLANKIYEGIDGQSDKTQNLIEKQTDKILFKPIIQNSRPKKPYYQHYSKQGIFIPMLQYVRKHPNPSGKPDNIPISMYNNIQVIPKRPWVYFGPQNVPPSDCQEINQKNFTLIFQKVKAQKKFNSGVLKKSNNKKKGIKRNQDDISEISEQFTSNFTFSDSVDLSKQSDLISEFRSQTKILKQYDSGNGSQSQIEDDYSSVSGSVTQRHRYNLFDSSESQQQQAQNTKQQNRRNRYKTILQHSDEQGSQPLPGSSLQGSSGNINGASITISNEEKGSSIKVQVDENQSQGSMSKSQSKNVNKNKNNKKGNKKQINSKGKKHKLTIESDSD